MNNAFLKYLKKILLPFKFFLSNILYLFKYKLKDKYISINEINYYLDNLKYELGTDLHNVKRPKVASPEETIDKIINDKVSIARFGDGEFELIYNRPIHYQKNDKKLTERLNEIIISDDDNIAIGLPFIYWNTLSNCNTRLKNFVREEVSSMRNVYEKCISFEKQYYSTEFTQLYMMYRDDIDMGKYFENIKRIWKDRDITIIQGEGVTKDFKNNIFEHAKSIDYIFGPAQNAFFEYEKIISKAKQVDKDRLILIILGPTATVLAYDLAKEGYQALDIGHTAKDYEFYKNGVQKSASNITKFFTPD